jgi:hypothetical protein
MRSKRKSLAPYLSSKVRKASSGDLETREWYPQNVLHLRAYVSK